MEDGSEYADDCAMLYPSRVQLVKYVPPLLVFHFGDFGMQVHVGETGKAVGSKSEVGFFAATYRTYQYIDTTASPPIFQHAGGECVDFSDVPVGDLHAVPVVFEFRYLGSMTHTSCSDSLDVDSRIAKAGAAFGRLHLCVFASQEITWHAKSTVYKAR
jgi:hypothetical protein